MVNAFPHFVFLALIDWKFTDFMLFFGLGFFFLVDGIHQIEVFGANFRLFLSITRKRMS